MAGECPGLTGKTVVSLSRTAGGIRLHISCCHLGKL